jgi:N-acetylmuramoyl-L-alanine amidase
MNTTKIEYIVIILLLIAAAVYTYNITNEDSIDYTPPIVQKPIVQQKTNILECPTVSTQNANWKQLNIMIDPGNSYTEGDKGHILNEEWFESSITQEITNFLTLRLDNAESTVNQLPASIKSRVSKIIQEEGDTVISIHVGNENNVVSATIPYTSQESRKLACLIMNKLLTEFPSIEGATIISINPLYYEQEDPEFLLRTDGPAILLELGTIQLPPDQNFLTDQFEIAKSIALGIEEYYEKS